MNALPKLPPLMTVADFLDWPGDGTGMSYELVDGVLRAMAPGSVTHGAIQSNLALLIGLHLRMHRPGCLLVTAPGIQPRLAANWNFRIPDLGVTCARSQAGDLMMPDPLFVMEVLSPGNAGDTRENLRAYATVPTIQEMLVVHSTEVKAELLTKGADGAWPGSPSIILAGGTAHLASIGMVLQFDDAYEGTHLSPSRNAG